MKKILFSLFVLLSGCNPVFATQIQYPIIWGTTDTVTNVKLNNDNNAVSSVVNGNLDNTNMSSGFFLYNSVASLPSPGNQGRVDFLTSNNTLNLDTGAAWITTITPNGALATGNIPYYNAGWQQLSPGTADYSIISNGSSSLPSYRQVPLATGVSGTLPIANGGTGTTTGAYLVPVGGIIMWSGSIASIPTGWVLCNGSNGTPDLRNRFIVGADADNSGVAKSTVTGSALQTSNGQLPATSTNIQWNIWTTGSSGNPSGPLQSGDPFSTAQSRVGNETTNTSNAFAAFGTGSLNVATFYALAYIMKT